MSRLMSFICVMLLMPLGLSAKTDERTFEATVKPLLNNYCVRCHRESKQEADLRLDNIGFNFSESDVAETWHDILNKLNLGEMPPEDEKQPTPEELRTLVDQLTKELKRAAEAKRKNGGQVVLRRLTRYEYNNTLRELLGIDIDFAEDLPPEPSSEDGFKNSGSSLGMSPLQLELYLQAARKGLSKAIVTSDEPKVSRSVIKKSNGRKKNKNTAVANHLTPGTNFVARILEFPREGEILVRVRAYAKIPDGAPYPKMRMTLGMRSDVLTAEEPFAEVDIKSDETNPGVYEFRRRIENFPLPGHNPKFPGIMVTLWNGDKSLAKNQKKNKKRPKKGEPVEPEIAEPIEPTIVVESVEFMGPVFDSWPPESHTRILFPNAANDDESTYAKKVIGRFASRAFRRPVNNDEVEFLHQFFLKARKEWPSFEESMRETLAMVLISPEFLYLMEPKTKTGSQQSLTDYELATRLSYFLWSSMPDEKLIKLAGSGELRKSDVLENQVRAMLASPKSQAFVKHFTDQWLNLSGIDRVAINPEYYPEFDDALKDDMRSETQAFFAEILSNDLSATNLIDSDFTMLNHRLAKHYGLKGPRGNDFERVALRPEDRRGGLLSQASILLSNSTGEDSHPIRRAVWLLDRLLDSPPSPPPPDVPELDADEPDFAKLPVKEQLELHRKKDSCNNCHRRIDPWGIAFENYDATGKWRSEVLRKPKRNRKIFSPVVSKATLPGGQDIDGIQALKDYLLKHEKKRFSRALTSKLLTYALGRPLELADEETVESLTHRFAESGYRLSDLIVNIVRSEPFQAK